MENRKEELIEFAKVLDREFPELLQEVKQTNIELKELIERAGLDSEVQTSGSTWVNYARKHNKDFLLQANEEQLDLMLSWICQYVGEEDSFVEIVNRNYSESNEGSFGKSEALEELDKQCVYRDEILKRYCELLEQQIEDGMGEFSEEFISLIETSEYSYGTYWDVYTEIQESVIKTGFEIGNVEEKKALVEHAASLVEYGRAKEYLQKDCLPLSMKRILIYFFRWSHEEKNIEKTVSLLKLLCQYVVESTKKQSKEYESYQFNEIYESILMGRKFCLMDYPMLESALWNVEQIPAGLVIDKTVACVYELPNRMAWSLKPLGFYDEYYEKSPNDVLELLEEIYNVTSNQYELHAQSLKEYETKITDSMKHIFDEDCFELDWNYVEEDYEKGYGRLTFERDYDLILLEEWNRKSKENGNKYEAVLTDQEFAMVQNRLKEFVVRREAECYDKYAEYVSKNMRKSVLALSMAIDVFQVLLREEVEVIHEQREKSIKLMKKMKRLCEDLKEVVYIPYQKDVDEVFEQLTHHKLDTIAEFECVMNDAIALHNEEFKKAWENETLEELMENKQKKLRELKRKMPFLFSDNKEETIRLYRTFLEAKANDDVLERLISDKYEVIWNTAMDKVAVLYKKYGKVYDRKSIEPFYRPIFTAEYLYKKFVKDDINENFDYSSIALEYFASMEYFLNTVVYLPLKELCLEGKEEHGYSGYMSYGTHKKLVIRGKNWIKYANECMLGSFGYLFYNIDDADDLLKFMMDLSNQQMESNDHYKDKIKELGKRIVKNADNISSRRNEAAHGGECLAQDKAIAARAIIYDSNVEDIAMAEILRDSFKFLLEVLNITEE